MRASDMLSALAVVFFGAITGWLIADASGALIIAALSALLALGGIRARIRPGVVSTVLVGTMAGALIGSSVVEAICMPSTCQSLEIAGGVIAAVISFFGVGLVAALVTRSFDEYNEQQTTDD